MEMSNQLPVLANLPLTKELPVPLDRWLVDPSHGGKNRKFHPCRKSNPSHSAHCQSPY